MNKAAFFQASQPGVEPPIANFGGVRVRVRAPLSVEQAAGVFRLIEVVRQTALMFFGKEIGFGLGDFDARTEGLEFLAEMLRPGFDVG